MVAAPAGVSVFASSAAELRSACGDNPGTLCRTVLNITHSDYLASGANVFLAKPLKIIFIILVALIVRSLIRRFIQRTVARAASGSLGGTLRRNTRTTTALLGAFGDAALILERRRQRAETAGSLLRSITSAVVFGIAFVTILGELEINLAPIMASAGIVGIAVGFGAQNLVRDFLSGIFMLLEDQYGVGDVIDLGPADGTVEAVSLRTTRLRDVEGTVWYVPNGEIKRVGNKSQNWSRAVLDIPVDHSTAIERARAVLKQVADTLWRETEWAKVIIEEPAVWGVEALSADGFTMRLVVKTLPLKQWDVARELRKRIKIAFADAGIEMQVPQREEVTVVEGDGDDGRQLPAGRRRRDDGGGDGDDSADAEDANAAPGAPGSAGAGGAGGSGGASGSGTGGGGAP